ncbi:unnamed protein product, partial [Polarella glacialis]
HALDMANEADLRLNTANGDDWQWQVKASPESGPGPHIGPEAVKDAPKDAVDGSKEDRVEVISDAEKHKAIDSGGSMMMDPKLIKQMKESVRSHMHVEAYDVKAFYYETGFWQRIARHYIFENVTLVVIMVNAIWIWIDTDYNDSPSLLQSAPIFQ